MRLNADATSFPKEWLFHYRWGKGKGGTTVPGPNGGSISFLTVGGRTSAIVAKVQKKGELGSAPKPQAAPAAKKKAAVKETASTSTTAKDETEGVTDEARARPAKRARRQRSGD